MGTSQSSIRWYQLEGALFAARSDLRAIYTKVYFAEQGELSEGIVRDDID